jgi:hypothetical protein
MSGMVMDCDMLNVASKGVCVKLNRGWYSPCDADDTPNEASKGAGTAPELDEMTSNMLCDPAARANDDDDDDDDDDVGDRRCPNPP